MCPTIDQGSFLEARPMPEHQPTPRIVGDLAEHPARPEEEHGPPQYTLYVEMRNPFPRPEGRPKSVHSETVPLGSGATVVSSFGLDFRQFPRNTHGRGPQNVLEEEIFRRRRLFPLKLTFQWSSWAPPVRRSCLAQSRRCGRVISVRSHLYHNGVLGALCCNR